MTHEKLNVFLQRFFYLTVIIVANEWKIHRRFVSPTINQPSVASHLPVFNDNLRKFVASLPTNGEFFDVLPFISTCLITMFLEAAFGLEWEPEVKERYIAQITEYGNKDLNYNYLIFFKYKCLKFLQWK